MISVASTTIDPTCPIRNTVASGDGMALRVSQNVQAGANRTISGAGSDKTKTEVVLSADDQGQQARGP